MRNQSYGDKQREAQRRKKEELLAKARPKAEPAAESPKSDDNTDVEKQKAGDEPARRTA